MIDDLIDIIESLALIMNEETVRLAGRDYYKQSNTIVEAKLRLVGALEIRVAQLARSNNNWAEQLDPKDLARLQAQLVALNAASEPNRKIVARQIELSAEMMAVVSAEAQRQSGASGSSYGRGGRMTRTDMPSPISVNTSL